MKYYENGDPVKKMVEQVLDDVENKRIIDIYDIFQAINTLSRQYTLAEHYDNKEDYIYSAEHLLKLLPIASDGIEQLLREERIMKCNL
jgi:hypothetical protein